ncbi:MAG: MFS transporter, partial [Pseudomonadales bacterium]|nr:MFS transporter [Pseudomonadales bacterium]
MQQLLITWLLVGILLLPAAQVGLLQALIGLPGIALMLWGGAVADRSDPRSLLIQVYSLAWMFPIGLFTAVQFELLNVWSVGIFGLAMSTAIAYASPSQQAILNRIAGAEV